MSDGSSPTGHAARSRPARATLVEDRADCENQLEGAQSSISPTLGASRRQGQIFRGEVGLGASEVIRARRELRMRAVI